MDYLQRALREIAAADPDGGDIPPTDDDHAAHQAWAVKVYGAEVWEVYRKGGWYDGYDQ